MAAITSLTVPKQRRAWKRCTTHRARSYENNWDVLAKESEIAAVKVGMLGNRGKRRGSGGISGWRTSFAHVVHDPVMKSTGGKELLDARGDQLCLRRTAETLERDYAKYRGSRRVDGG